MGRNVSKCSFEYVRPANIQNSPRIPAVWPEFSLLAFWIANDAKFLHADNEDSCQTARMRELIWVFFWRTSCLLVHFLTVPVHMFPIVNECTRKSLPLCCKVRQFRQIGSCLPTVLSTSYRKSFFCLALYTWFNAKPFVVTTYAQKVLL